MRQGTLTSSALRYERPLGTTRPDLQTIADAYIYLLGRVLVLRQEHVDLDQTGIDYNVVKYHPLGTPDVPNPGLDVAALEAWFAVDDRTPVVLAVPEVINRYYTVQVIDEWGDVIANINPRAFPARPYGTFAFVSPLSRAKVPHDAARIVLRSNKAKMIARLEVCQDRDGVSRLQRRFEVTSHGNPSIMPAPPLPMFGNRELIGVEMFEGAEHVLSTALDTAPGAAAIQEKVRVVSRYAATGRTARLEVEGLLRERVIPEFLDYTARQATASGNHWRSSHAANAHAAAPDFRLRTAASLDNIWNNVPEETVTFQALHDASGKPLNGSNTYVMEFAPNQAPASVVNGHWSLTLVTVPGYRVVSNPLDRYQFNSHSMLMHERDGSLKIFVGPRLPEHAPVSNWLPSSDWKPFSLSMRLYAPAEQVQRGEWFPPALVTMV
jgi:hypothetical protein